MHLRLLCTDGIHSLRIFFKSVSSHKKISIAKLSLEIGAPTPARSQQRVGLLARRLLSAFNVFQVHAAGGGCSAELTAALAPYEAARLDGTPAEGIHAAIHRAVTHSPASRFPYWCATLRLQQNLSMWSSLGTDEARTRFLAFFAAPSRVLRSKWTTKKLPKASKTSRKNMLCEVYRLPPHNQEDFQDVRGAVQAIEADMKPGRKQQLPNSTSLRLDFFRALLQRGRCLSFLEETLHIADVEEANCLDVRVLQVVTLDVSRKVVQHDAHGGKHLPLFIQRFNTPQALNTNLWQEVIVRPHGQPELVDGFEAVPWQRRQTIRVWETEVRPGQDPLIRLSNGKTTAELWADLADISTPALCILEHLRGHGWRVRNSVRAHTRLMKVVASTNIARRPWYLRCMLVLPELLEGAETLPGRGPEIFYQCCYKLRPQRVERGHPAKHYRELLQNAGMVDAPDPDREDNGSQHNSEEEEEAKDEEEWLAGADEAADMDAAEPEGEPDQSSSSSDSEQIAESEAGEEKPTPESLGLPGSVLGCPLRIDRYGGYLRAFVECPEGRGAHREGVHVCRKYRNIGAKQQEHFGAVEVAAYLGAWVEARRQFTSRAAHVRFAPKLAEVRGFGSAHGLW